MNPRDETAAGILLVGGISIKNLSLYKRKTISKEVVKGGKVMRQFGPIQRNRPKLNRNDACPCGSGRKVKNCHPDRTL